MSTSVLTLIKRDEPVSAQRLVNFIGAAMAAQGRKASTPSQGCSYRTEDGLKCAVGQCIPDERYHSTMEGATVSRLKERDLLPESLQPHVSMLERIQGLHDGLRDQDFKEEFIAGLKRIAGDYGLNTRNLEGLA